MNRRGFLGMLVGGVATAAAMRTFPFRVYSFPTTPTIATISEYADFISVSELVEGTAIDPIIAETSMELARRFGLTTQALWGCQFNEAVT